MIAEVQAALADNTPPNDLQAATLAAELIHCYPDLLEWSQDKTRQREFKGYSSKIIEAFKGYPYRIGRAVVRSDTGLPSRMRFKPRTADLVEALKTEREKLLTVLTNAQAHIVEGNRRLEARREAEAVEAAKGDVDRRKEFLAQQLARLRDAPG